MTAIPIRVSNVFPKRISGDLCHGFYGGDPTTNRGWTLPVIAGYFIRELEAIYGSIDTNFRLLGVQFCAGRPHVWFPGDCGDVCISLGERARVNRDLALLQLAHECAHLLCPKINATTTVVAEEGMAVAFSFAMMEQQRIALRDIDPVYLYELRQFERLRRLCPDVVQRVRTLVPVIADWTPDAVVAGAPRIPRPLAEAVCVRHDLLERSFEATQVLPPEPEYD